MNEMIKIDFENENPTVSGRELHKALEINSNYSTWFNRMCGYGFTEGKDFVAFWSDSKNGNAVDFNGSSQKMSAMGYQIDHEITIPMAKEICMIQRSEKGKFFRQYFISVEEQWDSPETVIARALRLANKKLVQLTLRNVQLIEENNAQAEQLSEMQPKINYYEIVLNSKGLLPISAIAKDYGKSARWLNRWLYEHGVQYKQGKVWFLYQKFADKGYVQSKTYTVTDESGTSSAIHTYWTQKGRLFIYELLKENGILPIIEQNDG